MTTLTLGKGFRKLLASDDFLISTPKYLTIQYVTKNGDYLKKQYRDTEEVIIKNIKTISAANYGKGHTKIDVKDILIEMIKLEEKVGEINTVNKLFEDFCDVFIKIICPRCYNSIKKCNNNPHNNGYINLLIRNVNYNYIELLIEGISKCFIAYLINKDTIINNKNNRWIECFSHIVMSVKPSNYDEHYNKSEIIHNYYTTNVFSDNDDFTKLESKMKKSTKLYLEIFYKYMYPALKYFFNHRNEIFVRHGLEKDTSNYSKTMIYPPNDDNSGWRIHKVTNNRNTYVPTCFPAYAIEIDKFPFKNCSSHSQKEIYGNVKGYININKYKQMGGLVHFRYEKNNDIMSRDHLFGESQIDIQKWVFTYKMKSHESLKKEIKSAVRSIISSNLPLVCEDHLVKFNLICELLINKFIILH